MPYSRCIGSKTISKPLVVTCVPLSFLVQFNRSHQRFEQPTKVLIYGESAGGTMTRYLLGTNPAYTDGLFSECVIRCSRMG